MAHYHNPRAINLAVQQLSLRAHFPEAECWIKSSELIWIGTLTPSPLSNSYKVRLRYKLCKGSKVDVLEPKLKTRDGIKAPHLYPGDRLCLYLPGTGEWDRTMLLSDSIIPWSSEWLLNYEIWLSTGKWCGGGIHPRRKANKR